MNIIDAFLTACQEGQNTDEHFRRFIKTRCLIFLVLGILGFFTALLPWLAETFAWDINAHNLGYFSGMGSGLFGASVVVYFRLRRTLKNPEKFRKERVKYYDERLREITRRAWALAGFVLLISLYLVCIVGGLFYPILHIILAGLALLLLGSYCIAYWVLSKKM